MILYRDNLESIASAGCQAEGCDHAGHATDPYFLHGRCHPAARLEVSYRPGSAALLVACAVCHKPVAVVAVAARPDA